MRTKQEVTLRRIGLAVTGMVAVLVLAVSAADAFTGPSNSGGVGSGAIATDGANNVAVGTSTTDTTTKLTVRASSTASTAFALQVFQPGGTSIFYVRNDGAVNIPGSLTAGSFTSTIASPNVSAGAFAANTGGGNFSFPASLGIGDATPAYALTVGNGDLFGVNSSGLLFSPLGSASAPAWSFTGDPNTGIYSSAADTINLSTGGSSRVTVSNSGLSSTLAVTASGFRAEPYVGGMGIYFPTYGFSGADDDTGMLHEGDNRLAFMAGSEWSMTVTDTDIEVNKNLGIGDVSPAYALTVGNGDLFGVNSSGYALLPYGAASTPSLTFTGDTNTGIYGAGTDTLYITTGGTARLFANTTGIGIGTAPSYTFDVSGTVRFSSMATGCLQSSSGVISSTGASCGGASTLSAANVSAAAFGANTGGGNYSFPASLGIGDASPAYALTVGNGDLFGVNSSGYALLPYGAASTPSLTFTGDTNTGIYGAGTDTLYITTGGTARLFANTTGIGIGTAPSYTFDVSGTVRFSSMATGCLQSSSGVISSTGASCGGASTLAAANVSSGSFGANTGGGDYTFPSNLTVTSEMRAPTVSGGTGSGAATLIIKSTSGSGSGDYISLRSGTNGSVENMRTNTNGTVVFPYAVGAGLNAGVTSMSYAFNAGVANTIFGGITTLGYMRAGDGDVSTTGMGFQGDENTGIYRVSSDVLGFSTGGVQGMNLSGTTLTVGGGTGKLNVGTIDPIYTINGEKFATYMAGMIGVKEEVAGNLVLPCSKGRCEKTIDFANEPKGSDLWLFGKTTDIKKHLPQASILLTPSFDGRVIYRKEDGGVLTIIATTFEPVDSVEVSYRFTAPRFDADEWSNRTNDEASGFIIND